MPRRCSDRPGGATHFGIGVRREEPRLLGVAAEGRGDEQRDAVGAGGGGHAVEGQRDVGAHGLALAVGERTPVLARRERARVGSVPGGASSASAVAALGTSASSPTAIASRTVTRTRIGASPLPGKATLTSCAPLRAAVARAACSPSARYSARSRWRGLATPSSDRRLEDARVGVVHGAGGGQRRQVGGALQLAAHADPARDPTQHDRAEHDRHEQPEQHHPGLAGLARAAPRTSASGSRGASPARRRRSGAARAAPREGQRALHGSRASVIAAAPGTSAAAPASARRAIAGSRRRRESDEDRVARAPAARRPPRRARRPPARWAACQRPPARE